MTFQRKYTVRQLKKRVDEYFATTPQEQQSVTGLALALDTSRQSLCNWEKDEELGHIVMLAKARIEHAYELVGMKHRSSFDIFRLKNMGWKDKQESEIDLTANLPHEISIKLVSPADAG